MLIGRIRAGEGCVRMGETVLKRGWNWKEGRENNGGQAGSMDGCLKKGEAETPLRTMIRFSEDLFSDDIKLLVQVLGVCKKVLTLLELFDAWIISFQL